MGKRWSQFLGYKLVFPFELGVAVILIDLEVRAQFQWMNQLDLTCSNRIGSFDNAVCDMHVEITAITWSLLNHIWL